MSIATVERAGRLDAATGQPVAAGRTVFDAAGRSAEFYDHLRAHYRETRRTPVEIPVRINVLLEDGSLFDKGTATIRNISPSGALLGDVKIERGVFPVSSFRFEIVMQGGAYDGIGLEARPVRFESSVRGIGVKFEEIFVAV
ncbi:MAG: hypothetical protein AMXMBFR7_18640 [Planctomycetota bacterium]|nr:hypothetical protein [Planctomycetota bacterium]